MSIIQISILGVVGVLMAVQLKQEKAEVGTYLCIVISLFIFGAIMDNLSFFLDTVREIGDFINLENSYIATLIKMLGITYLAEFSSGICKDAGYQTIAVQIEMFGKIAILVLSLPILLALLRTIQEFLP